MNPFTTFLKNLREYPARTVTALFAGLVVFLGPDTFGIVIPEGWEQTVLKIASLVSSVMLLFAGQLKEWLSKMKESNG